MTIEHLFFYGTLIAGCGNRHERAAHQTLGPGGAGQVRGLLYALPDPGGWYPAMISGEGVVQGVVYPILPGLDLAALDAYEGAEYRREGVSVRTKQGVLRAQAYVWAGGLPAGAVRIANGDFIAHAQAHQWRLFGT